jgi:cytoskeletal protein CcmA (bactofilin family)
MSAGMTIIGPGIVVTGTINAEEPLSIAGTVRGEVLAPGHEVTIERGGRLDGAATARRFTLGGTYIGRMIALDGVRLLRTAWVKADIASPRITMEEGATFNGSVEPARIEAALRVAAYRRKTESSNVA